ncbi:MAG TPA: response regulator transcription factor [Myxococcota bacterium]|nr:response regulator transcription factor [Myxococcota bacterium]
MAIRILLADDHPIFRAGLRSLLEAQPGVEILAELEDGLGAVEAAQTHKPGIVVIDVSMPGMNGLEATRRITAEAPGVKVLCLSMHSDRRFVDAALRSGAHGYLLKECALEELVSAIHAVLAGQIYLSPGLADAVLEGYRAEGGERSALSLLTSREREVLQLLAEGHATQDIAARLHVSAKTVGTHREHLMQKLGTHSLAGLTKLAIREGLTSAEK